MKINFKNVAIACLSLLIAGLIVGGIIGYKLHKPNINDRYGYEDGDIIIPEPITVHPETTTVITVISHTPKLLFVTTDSITAREFAFPERDSTKSTKSDTTYILIERTIKKPVVQWRTRLIESTRPRSQPLITSLLVTSKQSILVSNPMVGLGYNGESIDIYGGIKLLQWRRYGIHTGLTTTCAGGGVSINMIGVIPFVKNTNIITMYGTDYRGGQRGFVGLAVEL